MLYFISERIQATGRPAWLVAIGLGIVAMVSLGFDAAPHEQEEGPRQGEDMVLALPVPVGSLVILRSIDHDRRRSILVVDLDPSDPPNFEDTAVFLRLEPIPGVLLARSTSSDWQPDPDPQAEWWTFPHHCDVKVSSHPNMLEATSVFRGSVGSGNLQAGVGPARIMRVDDWITGDESRGSTRVGFGIGR